MKKKLVLLTGLTWLFLGCERLLIPNDPASTPEVIFDSLWSFMDEYYCYFEFKNVDWDSVRTVYQPQISNDMSEEELFEVSANMLNELKDGHTNLFSPFKVSFYDNAKLYPANFDYQTLKENYLTKDDSSFDSFEVALLRGDVLYIYYPDFGEEVAELEEVLKAYRSTKGMILDLRGNGGGSYDIQMASYFTTEEKTVAYYTQKKGPAHDDFFDLLPVKVKPNGMYYDKEVVVLTNRGCYSATSNFVQYMKTFQNVIQIGDTTGGGAGSPHDYDLPNGWHVRASHSPFYGVDGFNFEEGTPPDIVAADDTSTKMKDEIIEKALEFLND